KEPEPTEPDATFEDVPDEPDVTSGGVPDATSEAEQDEPDAMSLEEAEDESESDPETDDHRSLSMVVPSAFDARVARPRVVLHFHLSEAALRRGDAMVRPED